MADLSEGVRNANTYSGDRQVALTSLSKSNMTQDELDSAIQFIQKTATVIGVGDDSEGPAPAAGSNFGEGATGITAAVVAYFGNFNQG